MDFTFERYFENLSYSFWIWNASSRVWQSTTTWTSPSTGFSWWRVANTNTAVLPIPDFAWQMMSIPSTAWGIHSCWTENLQIEIRFWYFAKNNRNRKSSNSLKTNLRRDVQIHSQQSPWKVLLLTWSLENYLYECQHNAPCKMFERKSFWIEIFGILIRSII